MGIFHWPIEIRSADGRLAETVVAMVDTGASYTVLPEETLRRLNIAPTETREFELADGRIIEMAMGEARLRLAGREHTSIIVFGKDATVARLGSHSLHSAGLAADPVTRRLIPVRAMLKSPRLRAAARD